MKNRKVLFLDMDGTLYPVEQSSFLESEIHNQIRERTIKYICKKLGFDFKKAEEIFEMLMEEYPKYYSVGLKKLYGLERREYLDYVWNMDASKLIRPQTDLRKLLKELSSFYEIYLVSDAPKIWIENVSNFLNIKDLLKDKFSGTDLNKKKKEGLFKELIDRVDCSPENIFMVGDEEDVDIIPAKKERINTIHVNKNNESPAKYKIKNLSELRKILLG